MATYYKVVRVNRQGEYRSAIINGKACLRYTLGERTVGFEGMPVLLFREKALAQAFATTEYRGWGSRRPILAGKAGNPRRQDHVCPVWEGLLGFRRFWQGLYTMMPFQGRPPLGTYAADWFEPERVVEA